MSVRYEVLLPSGDVVEVSQDVYHRQAEAIRRLTREDGTRTNEEDMEHQDIKL